MNIFEKEKQLFLPTYARVPLDIAYGEGVHLFDKQGQRYLDFFSGLAVNALGYAHPGINKAVTEQLSKFAHLSNNFITDVQIEFTELLLKYSGMSRAFLTNSGTEAVEGVIKIVRKKYGPDKIIYSLTNSFHGRTYGGLTLTCKKKYQDDFKPLLPNISYIEFNDVEDLKKKVNADTAAVFVEFIQGEGGINVVSREFADTLKELRKQYDFALVADGIQCGIGRTGKPFSFHHYDIKPDIVISAKAIGGGLPLGAFLTSEPFDNVLDAGKHGTTFGGNPVSCAAGIVVLREVFENGLMEKAAELGEYFINELNELKNQFPDDIKEVRGKGFMLGVEMKYECSKFVEKLRNRKVLANCTNQFVVRILPPLIAKKEDIDFFLYNFHEVLKNKN
ncbi:MAG: acetylornithine/succinylornithine family transaminase [Ignavibacteriaceae bacterium]